MSVPSRFYPDLNRLVTRQITIFHKGVWMGEKLVHRTHKRSELGHTIIKTEIQGGHSSP